MALESMTLLQNKNNILPLKKSTNRIAVIGPNADNDPMLWGNYNGKPVRTINILHGIRTKLPANSVLYDKACDLAENKVMQSYFSQCSSGGRKGFKATYWNNREMEGTPVITEQVANPLKLTTAGQHEFASGVALEKFSALYETEFVAPQSEELVFKCGATGSMKIFENGNLVNRSNNWRTLLSRVPFKVEKGKNIKLKYSSRN